MGSFTLDRLVRSAAAGLALGLGLGAAWLTRAAVGRLSVDCRGISEAECGLAHEIASHLARLELAAAAGCAVLAAGVWLLARRAPGRGA